MSKEAITPYKMNLPTALKERIERAAQINHRSISGEIIHALNEKYPEEKFGLDNMAELLTGLRRLRAEDASHAILGLNEQLAEDGLKLVRQGREVLLKLSN